MASRPTAGQTRQKVLEVPESTPRTQFITFMLVILLGVGWMIASALFSGDEAPVSSVPSDAGSVVLSQENPMTQPEAEVQEPVAPLVLPPLQLEWKELGSIVFGSGKSSTLVPWDKMVKTFLGTADVGYIPDGVDPIVDAIRAGRIVPPPTSDLTVNPTSRVLGYLSQGDQVILYGDSDYRWSEETPFLMTYWEVETTLSEIKGASH